MFTIVHTSDLHIDPAYVYLLGDRLHERKNDFLSSFFQVIDFCIKEKPDVLLIAGDFYDKNMPRNSPRIEVIQKFKELAQKTDTKVIIATGNHDSSKSRHDKKSPVETLKVLDNITVFDREETYEKIVIQKDGKTLGIYGKGFNGFKSNKNPIEFLPECKEDYGIALLHGHLSEIMPVYDNDSQYAPFSAKGCLKKGFNYFALGHIHKHNIFTLDGTIFCYPGSTERYSFNEEEHKKGFVYIELDSNFNEQKLKFIELDTRPLKTLTMNFEPGVEDINKHVLNSIKDKDHRLLLRLRLTGTVLFDVYRRYKKNLITQELNQRFFGVQIVNELDIMDTEQSYDFSVLKITSPIEEFKRYMQKEIKLLEKEGHSEQASLYREAIKVGEKELREMMEE